MKYLTHNDIKIETDGHLQGYIDADYNVLVKLFMVILSTIELI